VTDQLQLRLHHACISVADLNRSIAFYSKTLGFEQESRRHVPDICLEIAFLKRGEDRLEIVCHDDPHPLPEHAKSVLDDFRVIGTKHFSISTNSADKFHAFLASTGVDGLTEVFDNNPTYRYFFFRDPDGITIEVVQPSEIDADG